MKINQILFFLLLSLVSHQQQVLGQNELNSYTPFIEVTGQAEMEVAPNEIYIQVVIKERSVRSKKITIEEQETKMLSNLKVNGIASEDISLNDAELGYIKVSFFKKDVVATKEYVIKTTNADEVKSVFKVLNDIELKNAYISKVSHSDIKKFEKELRIEAIKAAKAKAEYLVFAIDNTLGKPLIIRETNGSISVRDSRANSSNVYVDGIRVGKQEKFHKNEDKSTIQYQKIKLSSSVYVKFEVK